MFLLGGIEVLHLLFKVIKVPALLDVHDLGVPDPGPPKLLLDLLVGDLHPLHQIRELLVLKDRFDALVLDAPGLVFSVGAANLVALMLYVNGVLAHPGGKDVHKHLALPALVLLPEGLAREEVGGGHLFQLGDGAKVPWLFGLKNALFALEQSVYALHPVAVVDAVDVDGLVALLADRPRVCN